MHKKKTVLVTIATTLVVLAAGGALVAAAVVYGGLYDVASTAQHLQPTHTVLEKAMRQSVRLRARNIEEPPLADERTVLQGAACFRDKCVQCHGAPGVAQGDIGKSMQPLPGPLVDAAQHWKPRELYWVTRHGIKMSGMPAWELRQLLHEGHHGPQLGLAQPQLPSRHAAHLDAVARHPIQLARLPVLRRVHQRAGQRLHALADVALRHAGGAMALDALVAKAGRALQHHALVGERRLLDVARAQPHRLTHRLLQQGVRRL